MTWSIIARDTRTGEMAIAVATKFFAVGSRVPNLRAGVGALATQALTNPLYGRRGSLCSKPACRRRTSFAFSPAPIEGKPRVSCT